MQKRLSLFFLTALLFFIAIPKIEAAVYDPNLKWQTIKTEHFKISYPKNIESIAQKAAHLFEEVHTTLSIELKWKPWGRTEVVLVDNTDDANGFASVLPYNWIVLQVVPPRADSTISNYDDWLRLLITHEYTHILHLDAAHGVWKPLRLLLGKIVAPAGILPVWVREGIATYEETKYTHGGRGSSSFTEMLLRTDVIEDDFLGINKADGFQWEWPSYNAAYLYGVAFIQYLVDSYGEAKFIEFNKRVQRSLLLTMINHQAKRVYGKSFYDLWEEWHLSLEAKYEKEMTALGELTPLEVVRTSKRDERYLAPTLSPDGKKLAYVVQTPHHASQIRLLDLETGKETVLRKKQGSTQLAWFPDGSKLVFATGGVVKRYNAYFDLWRYDVTTKKAKKLTTGERARDPSVHPSGKKILYVAGGEGRDRLKVYDVDEGTTSLLTDDLSDPWIQFSRPQWSPDGKRIVVTMHRGEEKWKLVLFDAKGKLLKRLTRGSGNELDATWSHDGKSLLYSSDETGISNIYRVEIATGKSSRLSNVATGLFHPTTHDGETIVVQKYTSRGYELQKFKPSKTLMGTDPDENASGPVRESGEQFRGLSPNNFKPKKYNAFSKSLLLPRYLAPSIYFAGDTTIIGATTSASDPLQWHLWFAGVNYRLDAEHLGYSGQYLYNRFRPIFGLGGLDYVANFGNITFDQDGDLTTTNDRRTVQYFEERRGGYAFTSLPFGRHSLSTSFFYEDHFPKTSLSAAETNALNTGIFSGMRFGYAYGQAEFFPASISLENGRRVRLLTSVTDSAFGGGEKNEQVIFTGDWREYLRLFRHHVLGLRAAGGVTFGDRLVQGTFALGGALGEGAFGGGGSLFYFPLRGLPISAISGNNAMLLSSEYRIPLFAPQSGLGTTPIFLKNIHGAIFADYGDIWVEKQANKQSLSRFFDDFFLGVGVELRGDFVVGHGLPLVGRVGYAVIVLNRDRLGSLQDDVFGSSIRNGTFILQIGTSF